MKLLSKFFFLGFLIFSTCSNAQDKLLFFSGKVLVGKVVEVDSLDIKFERKGKKKTKKMFVGKDRIFAIKYGTGKTEILYEPDSSIEDMSVSEMELFVRGTQDARVQGMLSGFYGNGVEAPWPFFGGVVVGAASVLLLPFPIYFAFIPAATYTILIGKVNPKINEKAVSDLSLLKEEAYVLGFKNKAKNINIQNAIKGSLIGLIGGVLFNPLVYPIPLTN